MQELSERPEPGLETAPAYPTTITIAGIVWMIIGGGVTLGSFWQLIDCLSHIRLYPIAGVIGGLYLVTGLIGAGFIFVGVQSVRGTARDTLRSGIGSIIISLIFGPSLIIPLTQHPFDPVGMLVGMLVVVAFVAPGVLALVGRRAYKRWREAQ